MIDLSRFGHASWSRISAIGTAAAMLLTTVWTTTQAQDPPPTSGRPNVLLICVDDLKPTIGCYGDALAITPHLDALAGRGMRFDSAYCNQAVCAPSRNNLLVGSRSSSLGIYDLGTNFRRAVPDAVTLPQFFEQHGYHTAGLGKIFHVGHGNHEDPASWSGPFFPGRVIDYALPESTQGGKLTREKAYFSNAETPEGNRSLPRGDAWEAADVYPRSRPGTGWVLGRAVRTDRYRLVEWKPIGAPSSTADYELYDYQEDPLETRNLAAARSDVVDSLSELLERHGEARPPVDR